MAFTERIFVVLLVLAIPRLLALPITDSAVGSGRSQDKLSSFVASEDSGEESSIVVVDSQEFDKTSANPDGPRKRSLDPVFESDDLETAAGTFALRPLFVYRQQVAYRQRLKQQGRRRDARF